jgi:uncharacterized membrane protein YgcG
VAERKPPPPAGVEASRYLGAGLTWALSTLLFMLAGAWLGERLGSRSVGAVAGAFLGAAAGFYWLVRQLTAKQGSGGSGGRGSGGDGGGSGGGGT